MRIVLVVKDNLKPLIRECVFKEVIITWHVKYRNILLLDSNNNI